jgi:linoleoyl-CoA desaturase
MHKVEPMAPTSPSLSVETQADPLHQDEIRVKFASDDLFLKVLRQRVDQMFETTGRRRRDCLQMYLKTAVIFGWFAVSYGFLVFWAANWWQATLLAISLGGSLACIGFAIQHDGSHCAYSRRRWVNNLMAISLDLIGGSSYYWQKTHNTVHHTFTNITGHDGDIDLGILGRLSPHQPRMGFHRLQHLYLWVLYGLVSIKWQLFDDFHSFFSGKNGRFKIARPKGWNLVVFVVGKLSFVTIAFVIPMLTHQWLPVLVFFLVASFIQGLLLSVVFQLAHCVEEADFPVPDSDAEMENAWAVHQVATTVNFAPRNRLITWFTGSLNHQVEHHLFPKISHVNYPAISVVVEQTCGELGVKYSSHQTLRSSLWSHFRWLKKMGRPAVD